MTTVVIIKQEALNLNVLHKDLVEEGFKPRVIDATKLRDSYIVEGTDVISASSLFHNSIKRNSVKCGKCNEIIESLFTDHSVRCSCGNCHIDGGRTELIHNISGPYKNLSCFYLPTT